MIFGYASGALLASINWYRMGQRRKAWGHAVGGIVLSVVLVVVRHFADDYFRRPSTARSVIELIISLVITFAVVAYLHKTTEKDIAHHRLNCLVERGSVSLAVGIALVSLLALIPLYGGTVYGLRFAQLPRLTLTSTLSVGGLPAVRGRIHPWSDEPIANRKIVLCELYEETIWKPYDCKLTTHSTTSDGSGAFSLEKVPPGRYLVLYDSGMTDFDAAVQRWAGRVIILGDYLWLDDNGFFSEDSKGNFYLIMPEGAPYESFYYYRSELTLTVGGSPFFVAHDITKAISLEFDEGIFERVPNDLYVPVLVEVVEGYTSQVEFDVLYGGDVYQD
jgi:hypothetical protein